MDRALIIGLLGNALFTCVVWTAPTVPKPVAIAGLVGIVVCIIGIVMPTLRPIPVLIVAVGAAMVVAGTTWQVAGDHRPAIPEQKFTKRGATTTVSAPTSSLLDRPNNNKFVEQSTQLSEKVSSPAAAIQSARASIINVTFDIDPKDLTQRQINVTVRNNGPGIAYIGKTGMSYLLRDGDTTYPDQDIEKNLETVLKDARGVIVDRKIAQEPATNSSFTMNARIPDAVWQDVVHGRANIYYWITYTYMDDTIDDKHLKVAYRVMRLSEGNGAGMAGTQIYDTTELMDRASS